jgi:hypothetical protein
MVSTQLSVYAIGELIKNDIPVLRLSISVHCDPSISVNADPGVSVDADPGISVDTDPPVSVHCDPPFLRIGFPSLRIKTSRQWQENALQWKPHAMFLGH